MVPKEVGNSYYRGTRTKCTTAGTGLGRVIVVRTRMLYARVHAVKRLVKS